MFDTVRITEKVREEVLTEGKRGTAVLTSFLDDVPIHETPLEAENVALLDGITVADASVILVAEAEAEILLANDKGLVTVARSHDVECWWVTTLLFKCTKDEILSATEAIDTLYHLVDEGMNLHPKVYAQIQTKLREFTD